MGLYREEFKMTEWKSRFGIPSTQKIEEWDKDGNPIVYLGGRRFVIHMKSLKECIENYAEAQRLLGDVK